MVRKGSKDMQISVNCEILCSEIYMQLSAAAIVVPTPTSVGRRWLHGEVIVYIWSNHRNTVGVMVLVAVLVTYHLSISYISHKRHFNKAKYYSNDCYKYYELYFAVWNSKNMLFTQWWSAKIITAKHGFYYDWIIIMQV